MDKVETQPWPWMVQPIETLEGGGMPDIPPSQPRSPSIAPTEPDLPQIQDVVEEVPKASQEVPLKTQSAEAKHEGTELQEVATPAKASLSTVPTFQQTMTVPEIVAKVEKFTDQKGHQAPAIPGVNASNQRKGALTEVALTRREQRKQKQEKVDTTVEPPKHWDNKNTVSADIQCPPKAKGRKPKAKASPKGKAGSRKGQAKAKAKAKGNKTKTREKEESKAKPSKPKASPKTRAKRKAPAEEDTAPAAKIDSKDERKKQLSRKSAAYHKAFKVAKNSGETDEKCKELAKIVFSQHQSHLLVELFLDTKFLNRPIKLTEMCVYIYV